MRTAGELVSLAERFAVATARTTPTGRDDAFLNDATLKTTARTSDGSDDDVSREMREMLVSLGIASPVTKASAGALYHRQLSRQLADWLPAALARNGGILALPDVFCLFNRARGAELVSPEDVLKACQLWQSLGISTVQFRRFDSGVLVAQTADRSDDEVCAALAEALTNDPSSAANDAVTRARMDAFAASEALGVSPPSRASTSRWRRGTVSCAGTRGRKRRGSTPTGSRSSKREAVRREFGSLIGKRNRPRTTHCAIRKEIVSDR